jgi:hypothetical protein
MSRHFVKRENGVELWRISHPVADGADAFTLVDPSRTPEEWRYWSEVEALEAFAERVRVVAK